jgi:hypothetical protein
VVSAVGQEDDRRLRSKAAKSIEKGIAQGLIGVHAATVEENEQRAAASTGRDNGELVQCLADEAASQLQANEPRTGGSVVTPPAAATGDQGHDRDGERYSRDFANLLPVSSKPSFR